MHLYVKDFRTISNDTATITDVIIKGVMDTFDARDLCNELTLNHHTQIGKPEVKVVPKYVPTPVSYNCGLPEITKVIFNAPATIVIWNDGSKTVVKCGDGDLYDGEKGLALCVMKRLLGNNKSGTFNKELRKWLNEEKIC